MAKDNLETNPITIKPETASHAAEQFSWVPLPYCSPPGCPFPIKSSALSAHVSPRTIHFQVLDKSPVLGPGRGPPSCNKFTAFTKEKMENRKIQSKNNDGGQILKDSIKSSRLNKNYPVEEEGLLKNSNILQVHHHKVSPHESFTIACFLSHLCHDECLHCCGHPKIARKSSGHSSLSKLPKLYEHTTF